MSEPLRIAIAGLGTVGRGVVKGLQQDAALLQARAGRPLQLVAVSARDKHKDRGIALPADIVWCEDATQLLEQPIDLLVELIGGAHGIAKTLVEGALAKGIDVVTANKALIAKHGLQLAQLAEAHHTDLRFDAAVAGGIPIIDVMQHGVAANRFERICGILNGTCNYILSHMQSRGIAFDEALAQAQAQGFAETDPSTDIDGMDTAHKLAILTSLAFGTQPALESVQLRGIRSIDALDIKAASDLGFRIKLLGVAQPLPDGRILQRVEPCLLPKDAPLARIIGAFNAVQLEGHALGRLLLEGQGAGELPTASSVLSDILQIARGSQTEVFTVPAAELQPLAPATADAMQCRHYIRLSVRDEAGVLAAIAGVFAKHTISVESLIQREHQPDAPTSIVIITHECSAAAVQDALSAIAALPIVTHPPQHLPIQE
jgi:homoserine dehydrogenase